MEFSFFFLVYSFYLLYRPTLISVHALGVRSTGVPTGRTPRLKLIRVHENRAIIKINLLNFSGCVVPPASIC
jgi:hypothetical protein